MKHKLLSLCISIALVLSITVIISSASTPPANSKWAYINDQQSSVDSADVFGTYKNFGGTNSDTSTHSLTISSKYFSADDGWKFDIKKKVAINTTLNDTRTTQFSAATSWRVNLSPYSVWTSGCNGEGYIWYS